MAVPNLAEPADPMTTLLLEAVDDTNEAPWMTMPEFQYFVARLLVGILQLHARRRGLGWHVTGELEVRMPKPDGGVLTLGPDLFVVEADAGWRTSWDIPAEGQPPRFVLEVVTKDSVARDTRPDQKVGYYAAMGVAEYALYWPERRDGAPKLFGYRRDPAGAWVTWSTDQQGVLWSSTLGGLGLYFEEPHWLRLRDRQGTRLPSPEEEAERAEREADARRLADARAERLAERAEREANRAAQETNRADQEAARATTAEEELARLRALLKEQQG